MPFDNPFNPQQSGIMANFLKALQAYSAVQQIKGDQQDRQFKQDNALYERGINERQFARQDRLDKFNQDKETYDQKRNNFADTVSLTNAGAQRGDPKYVDAISKVFGTPKTGRRQSVATPTGETYYMPTQQESANRSLEAVLNQARLGEAARTEGLISSLPTRLKEYLAKRQIDIQNPLPTSQGSPHLIQDERGGRGVNLKTGKIEWENPDLKKAPPAGADPAKAAESTRMRVQGLIEKARQAGEAVRVFQQNEDKLTAAQKSDYMEARRNLPLLWDEAAREADLAVQKYPEHLEGGRGEGGYAFIQPRRR